MNEKRRTFLKNAALLTAASYRRVIGANSNVRVGGLGVGGRCSHLLALAKQAGGTELVALSDIYEPRLFAAREKLALGARGYPDYRHLLEQRDIDAVIIGSPDHWHVPMTIDAVNAGKDVYVEKPLSHDIEEGQRLVKVVAASRQIVQVGYQQRSWEHFQAARDIVASGKLGKITLVLASWYQAYLKRRGSIPKIDGSRLNWKAFLGNAPEQPFNELRYARWRWFWDFGGGHLTDLYSHYCDVIHWYMGDCRPRMVQAMGSRDAIPEFECPDTISAAYGYPSFTLVYNGALSGSLGGGDILFKGSEATMRVNRDGFAVYPEGRVPPEKTHYPDPETSMRSMSDGTIAHVKNFLDCVRSRQAPNSEVRTAVTAADAAHLGNRAYRSGARVTG